MFLSDNKKDCALVLYPDKKKTTVQTVLWDLKLIFSCIGFSGIKKALSREAKIKRLQWKGSVYYLWFIGVDPAEQNKGTGSTLLKEIIEDAKAKNRTICLETSMGTNVSWYKSLTSIFIMDWILVINYTF